MKDANITTNKTPLTDDDFNKSENFDDVLKKYNNLQPKGKGNLKWYLLGGTIAIIAVIVAINLGDKDLPTSNETELSAIAKVTPPIPGLEAKPTAFNLDASKGDTLHYGETEIIIPPNAFVDASGDPINGNITIDYREYHDLVDIFLSGIPMEYDSAGTDYHFESAGMFELKGSQDGNEIFISKESPLTVSLSSRTDGNYFNQYYFDEKTGKWDYIRKDVAQMETGAPQLDSVEQGKVIKQIFSAEKTIKKLEAKAPVKPAKADPDLYSIKIKVKKSEFPELASYRDILFEITAENKDFDESYAGKDWDDVELQKSEDGYLLVFYDNMKPYEFIVKPVLDEIAFGEAMVDFEKRFEKYQNKHGAKLETAKVELDSLSRLAAQFKNTADNFNFTLSDEYLQAIAMEKATNKVHRIFEVDAFGIFNSDCPANMPQGRQLALNEFLNKKMITDTLVKQNVYLADINLNRIFRLNDGFDFDLFQYNPNSKTILWTVTKDKKLGVFYPKDFEELANGIDSCNLELTLFEDLSQEGKIREYLKM